MPEHVPEVARYRTIQGLIQQIRERPYRAQALCDVRDDNNPECVIYVHGYDYAIPSNRPIRILWGLKKIGPWMHKAMNGGYDPAVFVPEAHRRAVVRWLVDEFNRSLSSIRRQRFVHLVTPGTVADDQWSDEIHPRSTGFHALARHFEAALRIQFPQHF